MKHLMRLTAPNESYMTGPGTNTYIVGTADSGYVVIDPGPAIPAHVQRIAQATGGDVRLIVCTHSHADHSPAAPLLQAACTTNPPILGMASAPTSRPAARFTPSKSWNESLLKSEQKTEQILRESGDLASKAPLNTVSDATLSNEDGGLRITLQIIHTPGHAANHVCIAILEDGLLFSGDHVLNGSTTVIDPPDGNMSDYLHSLDRLIELCEREKIAHILPAHGYVLGSEEVPPVAILQHLKAHRLARETKVKGAMEAKPDGSTADWVAIAYADTDQRLWPVAERSLSAHVERIRALGALTTH
jgi:recombination protein RecT